MPDVVDAGRAIGRARPKGESPVPIAGERPFEDGDPIVVGHSMSQVMNWILQTHERAGNHDSVAGDEHPHGLRGMERKRSHVDRGWKRVLPLNDSGEKVVDPR